MLISLKNSDKGFKTGSKPKQQKQQNKKKGIDFDQYAKEKGITYNLQYDEKNIQMPRKDNKDYQNPKYTNNKQQGNYQNNYQNQNNYQQQNFKNQQNYQNPENQKGETQTTDETNQTSQTGQLDNKQQYSDNRQQYSDNRQQYSDSRPQTNNKFNSDKPKTFKKKITIKEVIIIKGKRSLAISKKTLRIVCFTKICITNQISLTNNKVIIII